MKRFTYSALVLLVPILIYKLGLHFFQTTLPAKILPIEHLYSPLTYELTPPALNSQSPYPDHHLQTTGLLPITKHHFLCKGSQYHPVVSHEVEGKTHFFQDCDGPHSHSLPIIDGEPAILGHLLEVLNYAQTKTQRPLCILSGHRCYKHQQYLSNKQSDLISLHQMGSAADICFKGSTSSDLTLLIEALLSWYKESQLPGSRISKNQEKTRWSNRYMRLTYHEKTNLPSTSYRGPHLTLEIRVDPATNKPITYSYRKVRKNVIMY